MRTTNRLLHPAFLGLSALASSLIALAACSDSLHLDPQPVPPGGTSSGAGGHGGGMGAPCESSSDCAYPASICDTQKSECVECLEHSNCSHQPGTVCSEGKCACPGEGESFCPSVGVAGQDGAQPARCASLSTSQADCGSCGHACYGSCAEGACVDAWEPTSMNGAPSPRTLHAAVWTGSQMIIWGGDSSGGVTNTGGVYDPVTRKWTATSLVNAPTPRRYATAVWNGSKMIVWGGENGAALDDGAMYDPATNSWTTIPKPGGLLAARYLHTAVWTGSVMVVWGGYNASGNLGDGAKFDPAEGWSAVQIGGIYRRRQHSAVWAELESGRKEMIIFGGLGYDAIVAVDDVPLNTLGAYEPMANIWASGSPGGTPPAARSAQTAVWTGTEMIVWGGRDAGANALGDAARFDLASFQWIAMAASGLAPRWGHSAVWIGGDARRMVVWGGRDAAATYFNNGGIYDPTADAWSLEMPTGPAARALHTAVVTADDKMIIWGGELGANGAKTSTGAVFDLAKAAP